MYAVTMSLPDMRVILNTEKTYKSYILDIFTVAKFVLNIKQIL